MTRRRLREIRDTGATPVIDTSAEPVEEAPEEPAAPPAAPLPRAAEPAPVSAVPIAEPMDLGMAPLTRRQARQQERIRTASVPVIAPDLIVADDTQIEQAVSDETEAPLVEEAADAIDEDVAEAPSAGEAVADGTAEEVSASSTDDEDGSDEVPDDSADAPAAEDESVDPDTESSDEGTADDEGLDDTRFVPPTVSPELGSALLAGGAAAATAPPSFDQLIRRAPSGGGGASTTPNALILSQTPTGAPLVGPVTANGDVIITGTFDLPEGLGSVGHHSTSHDGRDADSVLIDGEIPAASSPTPIAASAAISTVRNSGEEIIRPPAPEKGNSLTIALIITAGALALALVGVVVVAAVNGVFS